MRSKRTMSTVLLVSMVLVAVSAASAWVAVGGLADATERALLRMESALDSATVLAQSTADSAAEVEDVLQVVGDGLSSTGDALGATRQVSASLRRLLGVLDFIGSVDDLKQSLADAEASLETVEKSLGEGATTVAAAAPALHETVLALQAIPAELQASLDDAAAARAKVDDQTLLWRLAIVAGALAILGGLWSVRQLVRERDDDPAGDPFAAGPVV
jgi:hypothetical protein